jgi:putative transposase
MPFWRLYYHIVWATYNREPLIGPELEEELYGYLTGKAVALESILHAIGGTLDHVHVVVSVPPKVALATFIGTIKGSSSYHVNHLPGAAGNFGWQDEYGVVSFAERHLPQVIRYVQRQKEHHQTGRLWSLLERVGEMSPDDQSSG